MRKRAIAGTVLASPKANADDFEGRFREVLADPSNNHIPRVKNAGSLINGHVVMHNGLLVPPDYYGDFSKILTLNKGVHEPQEERMFMEVLKHIPPGATMIELGAYWAFYSMWFQREIPNATNYVIEPVRENLDCGIRNFKLNGLQGRFFQKGIGPQGMDFQQFLVDKKIAYIDLLHADIQGAETYLLESISELLRERKIGYLFVSTHSQDLHTSCVSFLMDHGYKILASADFDNETFCYDGVLVARDSAKPGLEPIKLDVRTTAGE